MRNSYGPKNSHFEETEEINLEEEGADLFPNGRDFEAEDEDFL